METEHRVFVGNSNDLSRIEDDAVELVVTSPPYPMIEMWDDVFASLNPDIEAALDAGDGEAAFSLMHEVLQETWDEVRRVLVDGGIACINVGDATRTVDDSFRVYQNHARVTEYFDELGFEPLPDILWRKPANSAAKFMGSGMLPPNAYATLEHEYLLVFRNGSDSRDFDSTDVRYESAYFWEERNEWFSDVWEDVTGTFQELADDAATAEGDDGLRDRSAAYPLEIPYRLVNMYSTYGDTVLDPFWGTGTTSLAAMVAGRNSVGYELNEAFVDVFDDDVESVPELAQATVEKRLARHEAFVGRRHGDGETFKYDAEHYDFPVTTKQEVPMRFYTVDDVVHVDNGYVVSHSPYQRPESADAPTSQTED
ncbi:DNA-methyltransferase [Halobacterium rubrum]|uniref:DNA-methyltransferase n=1 Tax=Halobacterium TaxID=2239 RepID=UPI001F1859F9|nr:MULTISPECIES: site-specific DNA-methyltransferase [Halobacterium]MDH5020406.1 site-specific DNA-methyltransferase [Halobacterium rubrum]